MLRNRLGSTTGALSQTLLAVLLLAVPMTAEEPTCRDAVRWDLDTTLRGAGGEARDLYRLDVPAPGVLALDLSAPGAASPPRLAFLGRSCSLPLKTGSGLIRQTPRSLLVEIRTAGTYQVAVLPEDPGQRLVPYKLRNAFDAERPIPDGIRRFDVDPPASCDAAAPVGEPFTGSAFVEAVDSGNVDEWDCDVLELTFESSGVLVLEAADAALQAALYAGRDCTTAGLVVEGELWQGVRMAAPVYPGEHRLVLETGRRPAHPYTLGLRFSALCGAGEVDDHGDVVLCATPIAPGERHRGVLRNAFGDDEDVFTFPVRRQATFAVELEGTSGLLLALLDADGQRLTDGDRRVVRTLVPGRYFVRVTGTAGGEPYVVGLVRLAEDAPR